MSTQHFSFDGRAVPFQPGQTIGGALIADGVLSWRTTRHGGDPRGLFCGIGICFDCLVTVDGRPNQRACLVLAAADQQVTTQEGTGHERAAAADAASAAGSATGQATDSAATRGELP